MTAARADWHGIAGDVARALLGEPSSATGRELRFGRRGSLSVDLRDGVWHDHEAGEGGGVLDLVTRERRCSTGEALEWLRGAGFVAGRPGRPESADRVGGPESDSEPFSGSGTGERTCGPAKTAPSGALSEPERDSPRPDPRIELARRLWRLSGAADDSPGRVYLARRFAWPPAGIGPELPATVRWLPVESGRFEDRAAKWYGLPRGAAGALVFAWRRPGETGPATAPAAVSLIAASDAGERVTWFGERRVRVRTCGTRAGAVFVVRRGLVSGPLSVAEGEIDALALSLAPWCGPGAVLGVGGTAGMRRAAALGSGPVALHCDGDRGGRDAALAASEAIREAGRVARIEWHAGDPADALAEWLSERAGMRIEGGEAREAAKRGAWKDLLREAT